MHNHWDKGINLIQLLRDNNPSHVLECGAGHGDCTKLLASMIDELGFKLTVISDNKIECGPRINFIVGVSYLEIPKFDDESIDFCIIDTDHNYWTLIRELEVLDKKLKEDGLIVIHDTESFYHGTGMALGYSNREDYPREIIERIGKEFGGLADCFIDFLHMNRFKYKLEIHIPDSQGATVIRKKKVKELVFSVPGKDAVYANQ